jgi:hypothetical protein
VVCAAQAALYIAKDRIDPVQQGDLFGFAPANDERLMETLGIGDARKAGQAVGDGRGARAECRGRPDGERLACEPRQLGKLSPQGMPTARFRDKAERPVLAWLMRYVARNHTVGEREPEPVAVCEPERFRLQAATLILYGDWVTCLPLSVATAACCFIEKPTR